MTQLASHPLRLTAPAAMGCGCLERRPGRHSLGGAKPCEDVNPWRPIRSRSTSPRLSAAWSPAGHASRPAWSGTTPPSALPAVLSCSTRSWPAATSTWRPACCRPRAPAFTPSGRQVTRATPAWPPRSGSPILPCCITGQARSTWSGPARRARRGMASTMCCSDSWPPQRSPSPADGTKSSATPS